MTITHLAASAFTKPVTARPPAATAAPAGSGDGSIFSDLLAQQSAMQLIAESAAPASALATGAAAEPAALAAADGDPSTDSTSSVCDFAGALTLMQSCTLQPAATPLDAADRAAIPAAVTGVAANGIPGLLPVTDRAPGAVHQEDAHAAAQVDAPMTAPALLRAAEIAAGQTPQQPPWTPRAREEAAGFDPLKSLASPDTAAASHSIGAMLPQNSPEYRPESRSLSTAAPVGTPGWTRELHEQVTLLVHNRNATADIKLNPEEMGPIEIRIDFSEAQPKVSISVQNADTRSALDAALPRLRDMLAESGVSLGDTSIEQRQAGSGSTQEHRANMHLPLQPAPAESADAAPATVRAMALDRLVDTYA